MTLRPQKSLRSKTCLCLFPLFLFFVSSSVIGTVVVGQTVQADVSAKPLKPAAEMFRLEKVPVAGGAELITIVARLDGLQSREQASWVPLVSVLRDTLGDLNPENDRLRYVWPLTYTRPSSKQRFASAIPFLYTRVSNKTNSSGKAPPPVMDLAAPERQVWEKVFWTALQSVLLDPYGAPVRASSQTYRRNISDYRKAHIIRALSVLALYQTLNGQSAFSDSEMSEIQSRLLLTDKTFGGIVDDLKLGRYYQKSMTGIRDERGHNWELLRQRAEAESLYFDPLQMPDGETTHALVWVAKSDLSLKRGEPYSGRFLNISNPWTDSGLLEWKGYVETRYFDSEHRPVAPDTPGAQAVEMIPLALYGLDNPKIPMLLVDFRHALNPKKREMSRRVLQDVTRNVLSLSTFGNVPYFLGRTVFEVVTGRRGIDINQPSRLRTYSQLKLLLALNESLDPKLRSQIENRLEKVSLNPLENDLAAEAKLATQQHAALLAYAQRVDGLPAKLDQDRRAELVNLEHGKTERVLFRLGNIISFGKYVHREDAAPDVDARLDIARRLTYHTRFLREVSESGPQIDVVWNLEEVKRSLLFIAEHGSEANSRAISATAKIFAHTEDVETRRTCLESLSRINNSKAKNELLRISQTKGLDQSWKDLIAAYLSDPQRVEPLSASGSKPGATRAEQQ